MDPRDYGLPFRAILWVLSQVNAVTARGMPTTNSQNMMQKNWLARFTTELEILQPSILLA